MCFHSTCVARAAGKPAPCLGRAGCELPYSQLEKPPVPHSLVELGVSCLVPSWKCGLWPSWEVSRCPVCAGSGSSWHRLKPQLWGSGQIPEVAVTLCSHAPAFPAVGHRSCAVCWGSSGPQTFPEPPPAPEASQPSGAADGESSGTPGFGLGTRGAVVFPHPKPTPTQAAWPWLRAGEGVGMFVPLFLGKEHCWGYRAV